MTDNKCEKEFLTPESENADDVVEAELEPIGDVKDLDVDAILDEADRRVTLMNAAPFHLGDVRKTFSGMVLQAKADSDLALKLAIRQLAGDLTDTSKKGPYHRRKLATQVNGGAYDIDPAPGPDPEPEPKPEDVKPVPAQKPTFGTSKKPK